MATWLEEHGVELVVLAGYMHLLTKPFLDRFPARVVNVHPSLLPAFPGAHAIEDALAAGVETTGVTVHYVDEGVDTGDVIAQAELPVEPRDDARGAHPRRSSTASCPQVVGDLCRRALISVWDEDRVDELARGLAELGWELVSSGGTATYLEEQGLEVTRVEEVTAAPEMLGGRVKTLHPRIHAGILARRDLPEDTATLAEHEIEPFDLVCVNLYPFTSVAGRRGVDGGRGGRDDRRRRPVDAARGGEELRARRRRSRRPEPVRRRARRATRARRGLARHAPRARARRRSPRPPPTRRRSRPGSARPSSSPSS